MNRILSLLVACMALLLLAIAGGLGAASHLASLEARVDARFDGALFALPSRIYTRPFELVRGDSPARLGLEAYLEQVGYRRVAEGDPVGPGEFSLGRRVWRVGRRGFESPGAREPDRLVVLRLDDRGQVAAIHDAAAKVQEGVRFEPLQIGALHGERIQERELVALEELPAQLVEAVLLAEDQRFFQHRGLDLPRIGGAFMANLRAGRVVQGGSTITQQLVKNLFLDHRRTFGRKLREALLARAVERRRTKGEILEAYLNEVYLGQDGAVGIHGVGRAARHYFGRPVGELGLAQSALLAGILRGPSLYSPWRNPQAARVRRDQVLQRLLEEGRISAEEHAEASAADLSVAPAPTTRRSAAYFADLLRQDLPARFPAERLEREGLRIHTTLDPRLQALAERVVSDGLARLEKRKPWLRREDLPLQAALVALAPRSGEILALVGGRDYAHSQFDRATQARRQPGSVFKPVLALAALARDGQRMPRFTLASTLIDEPLAIDAAEGEWLPSNHDGEHRGVVTLRQALEQSLNVPIARLGEEVGLLRIVATARRLGVESRLRAVPSLSLGTSETTLLEMTRVYAVLAAQGVRPAPHGIRLVLDREGQVLERAEPERVRVFSAPETYLVTSALEGVVNRGTGASLRRLGFEGPVAGKTGTTDDYRDAWFVGYTRDLVVGVWVGFDDGESLRESGSRVALPLFADFMRGALGRRGGAPFVVPPGLERVPVIAEAGHPAGLRCDGEPEVFLAGSEPGPDERCRRPWWFARYRERVARERQREERGMGRRPWILRIPFGR